MPLKVYNINDAEQWDNIVYSFKNFDVYYLSGYVKAFQFHGDGEPYLLYYESDCCRGMNVVMKRDISLVPEFIGKIDCKMFYDIVTPYGYGGWIIEGRETGRLFHEYEKWCQNNNIVSEFVRYHPVLNNYLDSQTFYDVIPLGKTITMDLSSKEMIWANLTSKNRNMIRKAKNAGIRIYHGNFPEVYAQFREIYNATMDKDHAEKYYYFEKAFYSSILNDLFFNSQIFYAELDRKIVAASIILTANGKMNYHLSGSVKDYQHLAPTNLLLYETARWGNENGYKTFHLGGGVGSHEDSLFRFKKSFYRKEPSVYYIGKKIYLHEMYQDLIQLRDEIDENSTYFPKYRS